MSLESQIVAFVQAVGGDIKSLFSRALPPGGSVGQVLTKTTAADFAVDWQTPSGGGPVYIQETDPLAMSPYIWFKTGPDGHVIDILKG